MKNFLSFTWEIAKIVVIALAIVIPIRYFLFQPFFVKGQSMEPNFGNGDYLIIDEISYRFNNPVRGDVIVFKYPYDLSQRYIKRVIGLPGETIEITDGKVAVINQKGKKILSETYLPSYEFTAGNFSVVLGPNEYFVLGDNRLVSSDSRRWGPVPKDDIIGKVSLRTWPLASLAKIVSPSY